MSTSHKTAQCLSIKLDWFAFWFACYITLLWHPFPSACHMCVVWLMYVDMRFLAKVIVKLPNASNCIPKSPHTSWSAQKVAETQLVQSEHIEFHDQFFWNSTTQTTWTVCSTYFVYSLQHEWIGVKFHWTPSSNLPRGDLLPWRRDCHSCQPNWHAWHQLLVFNRDHVFFIRNRCDNI